MSFFVSPFLKFDLSSVISGVGREILIDHGAKVESVTLLHA